LSECSRGGGAIVKPGEFDVTAKSVYARDQFEVRIDAETGRMQVKHSKATGSRGSLVAVYAIARDANGTIEIDVMVRRSFEPVFQAKALNERALARAAEGYATRKMVMRLMKMPSAVFA
jgi:hypothetical protein